MEAYEKFKTVQHDPVNPFKEILANEAQTIVEVRISPHSIVNKVVGYASRQLKQPGVDILLLIAQDRAGEKAKKCTDVLHTRFPGLHQCNASSHKIYEDIWVPKEMDIGLDALSVKEHVPVLYTLLAKHELPEKLKTHPQRMQISSQPKPTGKSKKR
uniref:Ribonuclease P protein subunit p25-like protein n=1 Tax=Phallusia mammillata TaxID=59560 RepID=A0A6F9DRD7_9ASCI|nr:ribonuclease P protein subunit p25-like protein [Phallusia mammillata]